MPLLANRRSCTPLRPQALQVSAVCSVIDVPGLACPSQHHSKEELRFIGRLFLQVFVMAYGSGDGCEPTFLLRHLCSPSIAVIVSAEYAPANLLLLPKSFNLLYPALFKVWR